MDEQKTNQSPAAIIFLGIIALLIALNLFFDVDIKLRKNTTGTVSKSVDLKGSKKTTLPIRWGDLGVKMAGSGVIDQERFLAHYAQNPALRAEAERLLSQVNENNLTISNENSGLILNLFWALGLGTKNPILEQGPMADPRYGDPGGFASTGGWTSAKGNAMDHYSVHPFIVLSAGQQELATRVAKNIYRPCCDNSTYFPDCNHGMAMLGLLELMASQNISEDEMYRTALAVNSFWFPDTYSVIAQYLASKGMKWNDADPKTILGITYSSGSGYRKIQSQIPAPQNNGNGGCGVEESAAPAGGNSGGCGI